MRSTKPSVDIDSGTPLQAGRQWLVVLLAAVLAAGCSSMMGKAPKGKKAPSTAPSANTAGAPALKIEPTLRLGPPGTPRSWDEVRQQAARRLMAANPSITYAGRAPDVLLAIPVLSVQLNGDGSIRYIDVMRYPHQARDTVEIAKAALRRAEPFGDVSKLPKPWRFQETFLFNDQRQFKPLTLDR
jgi:hypothetical protein